MDPIVRPIVRIPINSVQSDLQAQLRSLYELNTKHKLSERSCVAIILKLIERGELHVIYTSDGKEYLTPQQVDSEIILTIHRHGGTAWYS